MIAFCKTKKLNGHCNVNCAKTIYITINMVSKAKIFYKSFDNAQFMIGNVSPVVYTARFLSIRRGFICIKSEK